VKIEFLGTRGNIEASYPFHTKHSGILVDQKILFDLGEAEFLDRKPKLIFITHLHVDHAFFVVREVGSLGVPIFAPETFHELSEVKAISGKFTENSHTITPIPTVHSHKVKSVAYLIEHGEQRVLYTGDLIGIGKKNRRLIDNLDLVVTDGSFMRRKGIIRRDNVSGNPYGHNGIPDLVELFQDLTEHIIFTHFGSWFYNNIQSSKRQIEALGDGIKVEAAYDGLVVDL
jgi:ribonuclease BN (tRNA processing enzyme)